MNHLMIDIETLGRRHDAIITQIGAVFFNPAGTPGECGEVFESNVDIVSQKGRTVSTDTIQFWLAQSKEASLHIVDEDEKNPSLQKVLRNFRTFYNLAHGVKLRQANKIMVWANGATFDFPILENAFEFCEMDVPWAYHQVNDLRTLRNLMYPKRSEEEYRTSFARGEGRIKHDALGDCYTQVAMLQELIYDFQNNALPVG